jgi:hypothetical protein
MAFTLTGDANLDGLVNDDDVTIVGATYAPGVSQPSWALGDFDYNGFVDDDDVTLLGGFYDPSAVQPVTTPAAHGDRIAQTNRQNIEAPSNRAAAGSIADSRFKHSECREEILRCLGDSDEPGSQLFSLFRQFGKQWRVD